MASQRTVVALRTVFSAMQEAFADISGDRNPMHMDPIAARRTQAGQPVVHGVHTLLWSLESLLQAGCITTPLKAVKVKFLRWVYLGDEAVLSIPEGMEPNPKTLHVDVNGLAVLSAELSFGEPGTRDGLTEGAVLSPLSEPLDLTFAAMQDQRGEAYIALAAQVREAFPALAAMLGARCIAEIAACSYIVGMEAPGLHSMFSKLDLSFRPASPRPGLGYEVIYHDERFRKARIAVNGSALEGVLEVFVRVPPVAQASLEEVALHVLPGEFAQMQALIIGGSRGLGEATAKIIATGGGKAIISYAIGKQDAESLAESIRGNGGKADAFAYDVRLDASTQIAALDQAPTHLFYFATGTIFRPKLGVLSSTLLAEFTQFYLQGFYDLCLALSELPGAPKKLIVFYPSTIFVEERPAGMTEYAMVKAAGEQLCKDMNIYMPRLHILMHRLPKLQTDQTAGIIPEKETTPLNVLIPVVRDMMRCAVDVD